MNISGFILKNKILNPGICMIVFMILTYNLNILTPLIDLNFGFFLGFNWRRF